jgi:hypothetical protein
MARRVRPVRLQRSSMVKWSEVFFMILYNNIIDVIVKRTIGMCEKQRESLLACLPVLSIIRKYVLISKFCPAHVRAVAGHQTVVNPV